MCKTRLLTFRRMLRYVKTICISAENVLSLYSEEERTRRYRVFSSFLCENGLKKRFFTKHLEKFICRSGNFFSESGFSLGEVGERIDDIDS